MAPCPLRPDSSTQVVALANRPGFPFLGNDFFREMGDCTSTEGGDHFLNPPISPVSTNITTMSIYMSFFLGLYFYSIHLDERGRINKPILPWHVAHQRVSLQASRATRSKTPTRRRRWRCCGTSNGLGRAWPRMENGPEFGWSSFEIRRA